MKQDDHVKRGLYDAPVPPVKGAVTELPDARQPEGPASGKQTLQNSMLLDGWQ